MVETRSRLRRQITAFVQEQGRSPTPAELTTVTGLSPDRVRKVLAVPREPLSLETPAGPEGDFRLADRTPDLNTVSAVEFVMSQDVQEQMRQLLSTLTQREQQVLRLRFGIGCEGDLTLEQIGERFSLTRERIRQIEIKALGKLRKRAEAEGLDLHLAG
jgi:RNA polymerase primary sigma factor